MSKVHVLIVVRSEEERETERGENRRDQVRKSHNYCANIAMLYLAAFAYNCCANSQEGQRQTLDHHPLYLKIVFEKGNKCTQ